jgi:hypothetical protein
MRGRAAVPAEVVGVALQARRARILERIGDRLGVARIVREAVAVLAAKLPAPEIAVCGS